MFIRKYGRLPGLCVPDIGEVVLASRAVTGPFARAAVIMVRRRKQGDVRIDFVWLENSPPTMVTDGYRAGERGHVQVSMDGTAPLLIRRIPRGASDGRGDARGIQSGPGGQEPPARHP